VADEGSGNMVWGKEWFKVGCPSSLNFSALGVGLNASYAIEDVA